MTRILWDKGQPMGGGWLWGCRRGSNVSYEYPWTITYRFLVMNSPKTKRCNFGNLCLNFWRHRKPRTCTPLVICQNCRNYRRYCQPLFYCLMFTVFTMFTILCVLLCTQFLYSHVIPNPWNIYWHPHIHSRQSFSCTTCTCKNMFHFYMFNRAIAAIRFLFI